MCPPLSHLLRREAVSGVPQLLEMMHVTVEACLVH
jgi:hypothetical protein